MNISERVLFIDDDPRVRTAFARTARGHFEVDLALDANDAEAKAKETQYAVIATDYRMPDATGIEVVDRLQRLQPHSTYMLVSGECDRDLALEAVNHHQIANVVAKPWDSNEMREILRNGVASYFERTAQFEVQAAAVDTSRALVAARSELSGLAAEAERKVASALVRLLAARDHQSWTHSLRVAAYSRLLGVSLGLAGDNLANLELGALLHDLGKLAWPDALLERPPTGPAELALLQRSAEAGASLLAEFPGLAEARLVVMEHGASWAAPGAPGLATGSQLSLGARVVAVANALDELLVPRAGQAGLPLSAALRSIGQESGRRFDPLVVAACLSISSASWLEVTGQVSEAA